MFNLRKITAMLTSALLLVGTFGMTVGATGFEASDNITSLVVTKNLVMDDAVSTYPKMKFEFEFTQVTTEGTTLDTKDGKQVNVVTDSGAAISAFVQYAGTAGGTSEDTATTTVTLANGKRIVQKKVNLLNATDNTPLEGADFTKPGYYVYRVVEKDLTNNWGTVAQITAGEWGHKISSYDSVRTSGEEYEIVFVVTTNQTTGELEISDKGIIKKVTTEEGGAETKVKVDEAAFENVYQRNETPPSGTDPDVPQTPEDPEDPDNPGNPEDPDTPPVDPENPNDPGTPQFGFEIKKEVTGDLGDWNEPFTFTIDINKNATESETVEGYPYSIYERTTDASGKIIDKKVAGSDGVIKFDPAAPQTFQLKHNQVLKFKNFPVGTTYTLSENVPDGYVATVDYLENGTGSNDVAMSTYAQGNYKIGEGDNKVDVTNDNSSTPLTGIVTDNLSFILLIVVAVAGISAYVVLKRRLRNR